MPGRWTSFDIRRSSRGILAVLGAVLVLNLLAAALFVQPRVREAAALEERLRPVLQGVRVFENQVEKQEAYLAALVRAGDDLELLTRDILSTKQARLVRVQQEVADLAARFGIEIDKVSYTNEILAEQRLEYLGMVVPLEGGYENLRKFIAAVERSDEFLVIESVALDRAKDGGALLELTITLATYFMAPEDIQRLQEYLERRGRPGRGRAGVRGGAS